MERRYTMEHVDAPTARLSTFVWRTIACQMTTYFVIGWLASSAFNYRELFGSAASQPDGSWQYMRSFDSPWVAAGPILQCVRGCLFGLVLWPVRALWIGEQHGVWRVWLVFVGLAILGPTAAAPGSLEGIVYTNLPVSSHLLGLPEMCTQTLLFCWLVQRWYRYPSRCWNPLMIASVVIVCGLCTLGVLAAVYPDAFVAAQPACRSSSSCGDSECDERSSDRRWDSACTAGLFDSNGLRRVLGVVCGHGRLHDCCTISRHERQVAIWAH